ncbi:uncharacterized protein LOC116159406 [Photinus pyralis]|uniref:uncharacterized protein LOC116159406 n=1 Tax=Photinus pyralis TaxID=7054 RepID=UPI0012677920|nr:uncharacterized protein LOC116159406 [Photinus pyralis]
MYFKFVLASTALLCVGIASGWTKYNCYYCNVKSDNDPQGVLNCRHFVNITATDKCKGGCIFYYGIIKGTKEGTTQDVARRFCSSVRACGWLKEHGEANRYCQQCQTDYCNTDIY